MIYIKKRNYLRRIKNTLANLSIKKDNLSISFFISPFIFLAKVLFAVLIILYLSYLFLLPYLINEKNFENVLNNYLSKNSKLVLDAENIKIKPNYKFEVCINIDELKLKYNKKNNFLAASNIEIDVNFLTLFLGYIDLNNIKIKQIILNSNYTKNNQYSAFDYLPYDILDLKKHDSKFVIRNIKTNIDNFSLNIYDENLKKQFRIISKNVEFEKRYNPASSFNSNKFLNLYYLNAKGNIFAKDKKLNDFDLNVLYKTKNKEFKQAQKALKNLNYNPFLYADKYSFYSKTYIDLKIIQQDKKNNLAGTIKLNDLEFFLKDMKMPKNNLILTFKNDRIYSNFNFNLIKNQFIEVKSLIDISKNKFIELNLKSNDVNLENLYDISLVLSRIFNLGFNIKEYELKGLLNVDLYIKSNFKTINSKGSFKLNNANLKHKKLNLSLDSINSNINLENDSIKIINTTAYFENSKFNISGLIDKNANLNLELSSNSINLSQFYKFLATIPLLKVNPNFNNSNVKNWFVKLNAIIKGNINNPIIESKISINDMLINAKAQLKTLDKTLESDLEFETYLNKQNKFLIINNAKNPKATCKVTIRKNNLILKDCKIVDNDKKIASIEGQIDNLNLLEINKNNSFANGRIRLLINNKLSLILPLCDNLSFDVLGDVNLNGRIDKLSTYGNLNLYSIKHSRTALYIKDLILNFKDSSFYINLENGQIFNSNFDLVSKARYANNTLIIEQLSFNCPYFNYSNVEKFLANSNNKIGKNIEILNFNANIATLEINEYKLNSLIAQGKYKNEIFDISRFNADIFNGKIEGDLSYNLKNQKTRLNLILKELNVRLMNSLYKNFSIAASGKLSALIEANFIGLELDRIMQTLEAYIKFNINDGELAQFAKLERFLQAGNILSQSIFKLTLNSTISAVSNQNTGYFKTIEGTIKIKQNKALIQYLKSQGQNMSLYMEGNYNLLNQNLSLVVLGRIPSSIVRVLGKVGEFNTQSILDKLSQDYTLSKIEDIEPNDKELKSQTAIEKMFSMPVLASDLDKIPPLVYQDKNTITREFLVKINGRINSSNAIQYFKWAIRQ